MTKCIATGPLRINEEVRHFRMNRAKSSPLTLDPVDRTTQSRIRLPLPLVVGNRDYQARQHLLQRMNEILVLSCIEQRFIDQAISDEITALAAIRKPLTDRRRSSVQQYARRSLRRTVARILSNESHRQFSCHLAESPLLQWFCGCDSLGLIRVPTKSTLQRMESEVPAEVITQLNALLINRSREVDLQEQSVIDVDVPIDLSMVWIDSTCAKLDIHYPTDWTLLRDGTRSIMRAIQVIRDHGSKLRMQSPAAFIATMNQFAMDMSGVSRRGRGPDKAKARKRVLRSMKKVVKKVRAHGWRYCEWLKKHWQQTDLSEAQARVIWERLERLLQALPEAVKQAHERIIGERIVPSHAKILSFYEPHAKVYVRGKAGADAEFGLQLLVCESAEGLIVDSHLVPDVIASDCTLLLPAIARLRSAYGADVATTVVTDRGFSSADNSAALEALNICDSTLPRSPVAMKAKLRDRAHRELHRRRAQTEARIGVFKANFLGDHVPTKGFVNQQRYVAWATMAHNLWVLARLEQTRETAARAV
jgi:hypothetical protein